jgi:cytochrome P450 family 6
MYGACGTIFRIASKDYKVPNSKITIRKGQHAIIPVDAIHMDPDIWPEPGKFDPERFTEENKRHRHPMAHLPFGGGPRNCIGLRFGLMQTKISLIKLLTNFKFKPSALTTIPMSFNKETFFLTPHNDMWLKVEKI